MSLCSLITHFFFKDFIYLFLERGREGQRERNINVWMPLVRPLLWTWPATQACALTGNWTVNALVCRRVLNLLSHTSQGDSLCLLVLNYTVAWMYHILSVSHLKDFLVASSYKVRYNLHLKCPVLPWPVWLSWLVIVPPSERLPVHLGRLPGCGFGPQLGVCERRLISVSLLSLPSPLSKNK